MRTLAPGKQAGEEDGEERLSREKAKQGRVETEGVLSRRGGHHRTLELRRR